MAEYCTKAQLDGYTRITKSMLGLSLDSDYEDLEDVVIAMARQKMDTFTGRDFQEHDFTSSPLILSVGANDRNILSIPGPIIGSSQDPDGDITKVEIRSGKGDTWSELDSEYWSVETLDGIANPDRRYCDIVNLIRTGLGSSEIARERSLSYSTQSRRWKAKWSSGYKNVRITYKAGFSSVPDVIKDLAVELADHLLQQLVNKYHGTLHKVDGSSMRALLTAYDMPLSIKTALKRFRSIQDRFVIVGV